MNRSTTLAVACALILALSSTVLAQNPIPNPGFESWWTEYPWLWDNSVDAVPGSLTKTTDVHSGSFAIRGDVMELAPGFNGPPYLTSEGGGFATNTQWQSMEFWYKYNPVSGDQLFISAAFWSGDSATGYTGSYVTTSASSYTKVTLPIIWSGATPPESCLIIIYQYGATPGSLPHLGTWFQLDDLAFTSGAPPACQVTMTGDCNQDGSRGNSDIIYLINHVLKGGATPIPCKAVGDVNCDHQVSTSDIIYLVNSILKGGPAPCDVCTIIPSQWSCP